MKLNVVRWMLVALCSWAVSAQADSSLGLGARYFQTVDSLDKPFEESGLAPLISLKMELASLLHVQVDGVLYPDGYAGSDKDVFSPQAFLLLGSGLYAGTRRGHAVCRRRIFRFTVFHRAGWSRYRAIPRPASGRECQLRVLGVGRHQHSGRRGGHRHGDAGRRAAVPALRK
jgi:hypothetical protein